MNKIALAAVISVTSFILLSIGYVSLDEKEIPFDELPCEQVRKLNTAGLLYSDDESEYSQDRILECLKEIVDESKYQDYVKSPKYCTDRGGIWANDQCYDMYKNFDTTITDEESELVQLELDPLELVQLELDQLKQMNCDEMIQDVYDKRNGYKSKDNRSYARDRTGECNDKQERPIRYGHCSTILISAKTPQNFFTDDPKADLINRIHDCVKDKEFQLNEVLLDHQLVLCDLYKEEESTACNNIQLTPQPYIPTMSIDELYPILIENEREIINNSDCSELKKIHDGKMQRINWLVHSDMIADKLKSCKEN